MKIYINKEYSYRRFKTLIAAIITTLFSAILFHFVVAATFRGIEWTHFKSQYLLGIIFSIGIPSLLLLCGLWILHAWLTNKVNKLEITDSGVKYGIRMHKWEQIKWFSCHYPRGNTPISFYQKKSFSFDYNLPVTDSLTEDEVCKLSKSLKLEIAPLKKALQIG